LKIDEATSALDGRTESEIMHSLKLLGRDRTTMIVAHRLATVQDADVIYVLDKGTVVEKGNHFELMEMHPRGLYRKMWESQLEAMSRNVAAGVNEKPSAGAASDPAMKR
jgi:ABC-type multidrug transport system fused ATPase/permease subunit